MLAPRSEDRRASSVRLLWLFTAVVLAAGSLLLPVEGARAAEGDVSVISRADGLAGAVADATAQDPATSADGRYTAFQSTATNLDPADDDATLDIYLRDRVSGTTTLVSRASGPAGAKGNGASYSPDVSADGRYVTYFSQSTNLHPDDPDATNDVYLRDTATNETHLLSRADDEDGLKANGQASNPEISADGRYVVFTSAANNLHPDDPGPSTAIDAYVRDTVEHKTILVSRAGGSTGPKASHPVAAASISADGTRVAFHSGSTNLDPAATAGQQVFVSDIAADETFLVSRESGPDGARGDAASSNASIAADGDSVAFASEATNLDPDATDGVELVYVRELDADTTTLASRASGVGGLIGDGLASRPDISGDGRYVQFAATGTGWHPDDTDATSDIYVRDMTAAGTSLVSRASGVAGPKSDGVSLALSVISADGRFSFFASNATNLHPDAGGGHLAVFGRQILPDPDPDPDPDPEPPTPKPDTACDDATAKLVAERADLKQAQQRLAKAKKKLRRKKGKARKANSKPKAKRAAKQVKKAKRTVKKRKAAVKRERKQLARAQRAVDEAC